MPQRNYPFGAFASVWVGDAYSVLPKLPVSSGTLATTSLTKILAERTKGSFLRRSFSQAYIQSRGYSKRTSPYKISFAITFYGGDDQVSRLAEGVSLSATTIDTVTNFSNIFTILCLDQDLTSPNSWLIPCAQTVVDANYNREKSDFTVTPIQFEWSVNNIYTQRPYYRGSLSYLQSVATLGGRLPTF